MQEVLGARYANKVVPSVTVNGKEYKIELVEVDNRTDKTAAVTAAQNLVSRNGVISVIGSYGSGGGVHRRRLHVRAGEDPRRRRLLHELQVRSATITLPVRCFLDLFQGTVKGELCQQQAARRPPSSFRTATTTPPALRTTSPMPLPKMDGLRSCFTTGTSNTNETDFNAILTGGQGG